MSTSDRQKSKFAERAESGEIADQACWSFIKEMNSVSEDRLDSIALTDGYRQYTYRQMFRAWERYAEAFSGIGLTGENHSRVGLISVPLPETIFALYGLNMTGASISLIYHLDLYDENQIYSMIEREKITDLLISEVFAFPNVMKRLLQDRKKLGIDKIIVIPSPMGGEYAIPALDMIRKLNKATYAELDGSILMEDLLEKYEAHPISYSKKLNPIILHTTGTVSGMHKPVPLTNKAINAAVLSIQKSREVFDDFQQIPEHVVTTVPFYLSWAYFFIDSLHTQLSWGANIVCLPMASTNPHYSEVIEKYKVNVLFTGLILFDTWNKTRPKIDLSELKLVLMGGTYIAPDYKKEMNDYLKSCGSKARFINGYGLSELGGACVICPSNRTDDAIGYLMPGFKAKLYVEEEKRYYDISDGPRTGVLLLSSPTMSSGKLDNTQFFELEEIDGEKYFNSHDLVKVAEDGLMTCIGRSNNYFVNNAGVRFDAGLVETAMTKQPGVRFCGLAPEFHKTLHDNIPILYVEMKDQGPDELVDLRTALVKVFIEDELISDTNLPSQAVLVEHMPLNSNGKVDAKLLKQGAVKGVRYSIRPVHVDDKLLDVILVPANDGEFATVGAGVPKELENDSYNILGEFFAAVPEMKEQGITRMFSIPGFRELVIKLTDFDIENIPQSVINLAPKVISLAYKNDWLPFVKEVGQLEEILPMLRGSLPMPPVPPLLPFWNPFVQNQMSTVESSIEQVQKFFNSLIDMLNSFLKTLPAGFQQFSGFTPFYAPPKDSKDGEAKTEEEKPARKRAARKAPAKRAGAPKKKGTRKQSARKKTVKAEESESEPAAVSEEEKPETF